MPLLPSVDEFLAAIESYQAGFRHTHFSYLAIKFAERYQIVRGRLYMQVLPPGVLPPNFQSPHVRAGHYTLEGLDTDVRGLIAQLLAGGVETPDGPLEFPAAPGGHHSASFLPLHPDGLMSQTRVSVLTITGGETKNLRQPEIDWEVKAASRPYDNLQELANEWSLGLTSRPPQVEIVATPIAAIDAQNSKVSGDKAIIQVRLARGLEQDRIKVGYRLYAPGKITTRDVLQGGSMTWSEEENVIRGEATIQVPLAAALNCTVSYDGIAQSHYWLFDPHHLPNPRRAVYETFDAKLENLKAIITNAQGRGAEARDLESAVAWILWMLGFSVAHLNTRTMREAADLIATTPQGHFAIVECTTGILKAESKLALLHDRAEAARRGLAGAGSANLRLLPVIVTSKTRNEISPDLENAERLGVLVVTRETLDNAIVQRTLMVPNADQVYAEAEQAIKEALAKYQPQLAPPLGSRPM